MIKRVKLILVISLLIILCSNYIRSYLNNKYNITSNDKDMCFKIKYKGLDSGRDFVVDFKGNYYIAFKSRIQFIDVNGKSYNLLENDSLNINSLEYLNDKLYFASNCSVFSFDLKDRSLLELVKDLPNFGDYKNSIIRASGEELYVSIGAATNSGVVGPDNEWVKTNTYNHDISPFSILIKALKFGLENTGAFVPYKTRNVENQIIPGHLPGNASIIKINTRNKESETFAWGIRNIKGMDFDSKGKLYATVGGMENRGLRPIQYDYDYIFQINKGKWYGWPDYSGGDPINSPRFNNNRNSFIMEKHPTVNPPAPMYQNKYLNTLGALTIDKKNDFKKSDSIFFYDQKLKSISEISKDGNLKEKIALNSKSNISSIKFYQGSLMLLDSKAGYIIQVTQQKLGSVNKFNIGIFYVFIIAILIGILFTLKALYQENSK